MAKKIINTGFMPLDETIETIQTVQALFQHKRLSTWFDKVTFLNIFLVWTSVISVFGLIYYFFSNEFSHLIYSKSGEIVKTLIDPIYFSFITATSTGFGDIVPIGQFKIVAIVEVVFGLLLLAFVTSKLISLKQDLILREIYEMSFNEKLNRIRSSLILFRQNIGRIIGGVEDKSLKKGEINELYTYISSLEDILTEIYTILEQKGITDYIKGMDSLNTELIFNSIQQSFEKINEMILVLDENKIVWRREVTIGFIRRGLELNKLLVEKVSKSQVLNRKCLMTLQKRSQKVHDSIYKNLKLPKNKEESVEIVKDEKGGELSSIFLEPKE